MNFPNYTRFLCNIIFSRDRVKYYFEKPIFYKGSKNNFCSVLKFHNINKAITLRLSKSRDIYRLYKNVIKNNCFYEYKLILTPKNGN